MLKRTMPVILLCGSAALADFCPATGQNPATSPPGGKSPCYQAQSALIVSQVPDQDRAAMGEDYLPGMVKKTRMEWYQLIPQEARPPESKKGCTLIEFTIHTDGEISDMRLDVPSGDVGMDRAAWTAVKNAAPFQPFPVRVQVQKIVLRFQFLYNEKNSGDSN
jgi:TonB family protein